MSRFGLTTYVIFILFLVISCLILPSGDEPDFEVRVNRLQQIDGSSYSPYGYVEFFPNAPLDSRCEYISGSQSVVSAISPQCIRENIDLIAEKLLHTLSLTLPFFLLSVFRKSYLPWICRHCIFSQDKLERMIDATALAILWPSVVYMLSWTSEEVFTNILLLMLLIISQSYILVLLLLIWILMLDHGSFLVLLTFIMFSLLFRSIHKFSFKGLAVVFLIAVSSCYFFGESILRFVAELNIQSKPAEVYGVIVAKDAYGNYPLIARPVISIISFVFMTASGIKPFFLYMFVAISFFIFLAKRKNLILYELFTYKNSFAVIDYQSRKLLMKNRSISDLLALIATILCIVFIAPTHAYAKYYLFMTPFICYFFLMWFSRWQALKFIILANSIMYLNIGIYYLWSI